MSRNILFLFVITTCANAGTFHGYDNIDSIDDGSCTPPYPEANVNKNFMDDLQPEGGFFLPFNSKMEAISIAEAILGRKLTNDDDPINYCPRLNWQTNGGGMSLSGNFFGFRNNNASIFCEKQDEFGNTQKCRVEHAHKKLQMMPETHWTLTDGETFVLLIICKEDRKQLFSVISTKPTLDTQSQAKIGAHLLQLGFKPDNFNTVDFSQC